MGRVVSAILWGVIGAVVLGAIAVGVGLSLPRLTNDPSAAAGTAVMALIAAAFGLIGGVVFGFRRAS